MIMLIDKIVTWFNVVNIYFPRIPSCSSLKTVISLQFPYTGSPQITIVIKPGIMVRKSLWSLSMSCDCTQCYNIFGGSCKVNVTVVKQTHLTNGYFLPEN